MLIGNRIFEIRKNMKLSQEELAEKLNVSRQTVSNWETDQTVPDIYQTKELANALNVSLDELVGYKEITKKYSPSKSLVDASAEWRKIKVHLTKVISQTSYEIWFEDITKAKANKEEFVLYVDERIKEIHINEYYSNTLLNIINEYYSKDIKKVIIVFEKNMIKE